MRRFQLNDSLLDSPEHAFDGGREERYDASGFGPIIEEMEDQGAIVFHDVPGDGFSLDHVAIHPTGIYVLETSHWIAPGRDRSVVSFDGASISLNGEAHSDEPITRARATGAWLRDMLQSATGRPVVVRPTLVFPGWFVESEQPLDADMLVLSPGALPRFLANARPVLSGQDVMLVAYHLSRYIGGS